MGPPKHREKSENKYFAKGVESEPPIRKGQEPEVKVK